MATIIEPQVFPGEGDAPAPKPAPAPVASVPPRANTTLGGLAAELVGPQLRRVQESQEAEAQIAREKSAAMDPLISEAQQRIPAFTQEAQQRQAGVAAQKPTLTQPPNIAPRPFLAPVDNEPAEKSIGKFIQAVGLFAAGVGGLAIGDARGALGAISGAMQGWQEGDALRSQRMMAEWQAKTQAALKQWEVERQSYEDWFKTGSLSISELMQRLQLEALRHGNKAAAQAVTTQGAAGMLNFLAQQDKLATDVGLEMMKIAVQQQIAMTKMVPETIQAEMMAMRELGLTPNINGAIKRIWERDVEKSRQQGAAAAEVKRGQPLTPKESENLVHPMTMQGPPPGLTMADAIQQGYREVDEKDRAALADLQQTRAIVGTLNTMASRLITAKTPAEAAAQYARLSAGAFTGSDPTARTYVQTRDSFLGTVSRALAGERGVLTEGDIRRIGSAFPGFMDTATVRDAKIGLLNLLIDTAQRGREAKMLKRPMDTVELRSQIDGILSRLEAVGPESGLAAPPPGGRRIQ